MSAPTKEEIRATAKRFADSRAVESSGVLEKLIRASLAEGFLAGWHYGLTGKAPQ